jgi:hypothetical protein
LLILTLTLLLLLLLTEVDCVKAGHVPRHLCALRLQDINGKLKHSKVVLLLLLLLLTALLALACRGGGRGKGVSCRAFDLAPVQEERVGWVQRKSVRRHSIASDGALGHLLFQALKRTTQRLQHLLGIGMEKKMKHKHIVCLKIDRKCHA